LHSANALDDSTKFIHHDLYYRDNSASINTESRRQKHCNPTCIGRTQVGVVEIRHMNGRHFKASAVIYESRIFKT
jgi:hypothetical protein